MANFSNPYSNKPSGGFAVNRSQGLMASKPGQAQPVAPSSQGTPYSAYSQPSRTTVSGSPMGAYASAPATQRPPAFQMGTAKTPWGQSKDPFVERTAFINQLNQQRAQTQTSFNSGGQVNPAAGMTPGLDYQKAMQQAGLGGGAPSMAANYGDSMIGRLNESFGGNSPRQHVDETGFMPPARQPVDETGFMPAYPGWSPGDDFGIPRSDGSALWGSPAGKAQSIPPPSQGSRYGGGLRDYAPTQSMPTRSQPPSGRYGQPMGDALDPYGNPDTWINPQTSRQAEGRERQAAVEELVRKYGVTPGEAMERYDSSRKRDMDAAANEWRRANQTPREIEAARRAEEEREAVRRALAGNAEAATPFYGTPEEMDRHIRQQRVDSGEMPSWYANMPPRPAPRQNFQRGPVMAPNRRYG